MYWYFAIAATLEIEKGELLGGGVMKWNFEHRPSAS
jgi:hypothetical protein